MLPILTIFLGAFLVFLVQPLIGNTILPALGGTAAVWSSCLAAFQILLVGGYFYAHIAGRTLTSGKAARWLHLVFLVGSVAWLFVSATHYRSVLAALSTGQAAMSALGAVAALVAVPYIVLSSNSSLVQLLAGGKYRLYAVSNLGSILGLLAYPFVMERYFPISMQWRIFAAFSALYVLFFAALMFVGKRRTQDERRTQHSALSTQHSATRTPHYFFLSFISCYLLNAVSTHLCTDITPLPMLWVALLGLYLLSYVFAFSDGVSRYAPCAAVLVVPLACIAAWHFGEIGYTSFLPELALGLSLLFLGGLIVHSRLYRIRPRTDGLTRYYLMIALGGAVGGAFCSFVMPYLTNIVAEYPIALALVLLVIGCDVADVVRQLPAHSALRTLHSELCTQCPALRTSHFALLILAVFAIYGIYRGHSAEGTVLTRYRNFYGLGYVAHKVMSVDDGKDYEANEFRSNGTIHGFQKVDGAWKGMMPTVYYAEHAGGLPILKHPKFAAKKPMRVALCGMGIGTLASYARDGDFYRFYEINPAVAKIATNTNLFTFVSRASGKVDVVLDDARRALERERAANEPKYDVIIADVFNGDAIPPHTATREAFRLYLDRLEPDGILAFHLSNWHLDLLPMVKAAREEFELCLDAYVCRPTLFAYASTWAFMSPAMLPPGMYDPKLHDRVNFKDVRDIPLMTDDFHSLIPYLRLKVTKESEEN